MGDRTYYRLALPAGLDREAARVAAAAFTDDPWTEADVTRLLDRTPSDRPVWIDIQERSPPRPVLAALGEVDQDLAFTVTEDPRREWPGTMCRYQPGRGMHEVDGAAEVVERAVADGDRPLLLAISDNGPQMRSHTTTREFLAGVAIARQFGRPGVPQDQAWIETLFGHLKGEWPHLEP